MTDFPFKPQRRKVIADTECAHGYWLLKLKDIESGVIETHAIWPGSQPLNVARLEHVIRTSTLITFNGNHYDIQMIALAMTGADTVRLKEANDAIIQGGGRQGLKPWPSGASTATALAALHNGSPRPRTPATRSSPVWNRSGQSDR